MLHVLISEKEHLDAVWDATDETVHQWVLPKNANPRESVALFFPSENGFVAIAKIQSKEENSTKHGDRIVYCGKIDNIELLKKTITIDKLKESSVEEIRVWPWLRYPRSFTTLKPPRSQKLLEILEAELPRRRSRAKQVQTREQAELPPASQAKQAQAREKTEMEAMEGIAKEQKALSRSRSKKLRDEAKRLAKGKCYTCETNFSQFLDGLGERVLEAHHKKQVALMKTPELTNVKDLAVVCANCHRMIHADPKNAIKVDDLRKRLKQAPRR